MNEISTEDIQFLDKFFSEEELSDEGMKELDKRLKNPFFKQYYQDRLNQKYDVSAPKKFIAYLPMLILIGLTIIGIYLILLKIEW
jgi:uncharacterized membrane protein